MKHIILAMFIVATQLINTLAIAQDNVFRKDLDADDKLTAELAEVKQKKLSIESKHKTQEAECYQKFAVNNCLRDINSEKLLALREIKRRELEINEQKRLLKAETVNKKKSNKVIENEDAPASNSNSKKSPKAEKPSRSETKLIAPIQKDQATLSEQRTLAAQQRVLDASKKQAASLKKMQSRAEKLSQANNQEAQFNKKQLDAQAHKSAIEKALADKANKKSALLPIPSSGQAKP